MTFKKFMMIAMMLMTVAAYAPSAAQAAVIGGHSARHTSSAAADIVQLPGITCVAFQYGRLRNQCGKEVIVKVYFRTTRRECAAWDDNGVSFDTLPLIVTDEGATLRGKKVMSVSFIDEDGRKFVKRYGASPNADKCKALQPKPKPVPAPRNASSGASAEAALLGIGGWLLFCGLVIGLGLRAKTKLEKS